MGGQALPRLAHATRESRALSPRPKSHEPPQASEGGKARRFHTYAGLITCAICGCACSPIVAKGQYTYYSCSGAKGCRRQGVREEVLDLAIAQQLEGLTIAPAVLELLRRAIREMHAEQKQAHTDRHEALQKEHSNTLDRLEKLYLDRIAGKVPDATYDKLSAEWQTKAAELVQQLAAADRANHSTWEDNVRMLEAVSNSAARFKTADSATKRAMAKNLLSNFTLSAGNVALELEPWFKMVAIANTQTQENAPVGDVLETWWAQLDSN